MRLAVVAGTTPACLPELERRLERVDLILHAGRIGGAGVLSALERWAPVRAVISGQDYLDLAGRLPESVEFEAGPARVLMTHMVGPLPEVLPPVQRRIDTCRPDLVVSGHQPVAQVLWIGGTLFVAPGHAGIRHGRLPRTCALLEIEGRAEITAHVYQLSEHPQPLPPGRAGGGPGLYWPDGTGGHR